MSEFEKISWSREAEMGVLGSIFLIGHVPEKWIDRLQVDHFASEAHQAIYRGFVDMTDVFGERGIDQLTMGDHFKYRFEEVGGDDYLFAIAEFTPSPANLEHYIKIVQDHWIRRQYVALCRQADNPDTPIDELTVIAEGIIRHTLAGSSTPVCSRVGIGQSKEPREGITTGVTAIDNHLICKGFPKGQMSVVSAYHKAGKTSFMLSCAIAAAKKGKRVLYATFADLNKDEIEERVMKQETGWANCPTIDPGLAEHWSLVRARYQSESWIDVYDAAGLDSGYDVETFGAWLSSNNVYEDVFVDYAQELHSRDRKATSELAEASIVASLLARLARKMKLPVVVGSQITEGKDGGKDKTKGSRVWEEKAGLVLRLRREEDSDLATVEIPFNRFGPKGKVQCQWNSKNVKFEF